MKGVVFNLLERVVVDAHGDDAWDDLVEAAGVGGSYTSLGSYPDEELGSLVAAASSNLGLPAGDVIRWFGEQTLPLFVAGHPTVFEGHTTTRSFVQTLNDVIHPEVHKLYPGAATPRFRYSTLPDGTLLMEYVSDRALCRFAEGLLRACVSHFGDAAEVAHASCRQQGDERCVLSLSPDPPIPAPSRSIGGSRLRPTA